MPVINARSFKPFVWIPPSTNAKYKITVERSNGTIDDVTDEILSFSHEYGVTNFVAKFSLVVSNGDASRNGVWSELDVVRFYSDYSSTATTLRFRGRIERINYSENKVELVGRGEERFFADLFITRTAENIEASQLLLDIISSKNDGTFTTTNVNTTSTYMTVNWVDKPFWDCVVDICRASGFDAYVDPNKDWNFFERGSRTNNTDAAVRDKNILSMDDFSTNTALIKNKIIAYGASIDGIQLIHTSEDVTSQSNYGVRQEKVADSGIEDYASLKEFADYVLSEKKDPPIEGSIECILMATIQPGEKLLISAPDNNLPPAYYVVDAYSVDLGEDAFNTTISINKKPRVISDVIKETISRESQSQESTNPNDLSFSYGFTFQEDTGSHTNTQIDAGNLRTTGGSSGTWISYARSASNNITEAQVYVYGQNLDQAIISISADNGVSFESFTHKEYKVLTTTIGTQLVIKVEFSSSDARVTGLNVLYK